MRISYAALEVLLSLLGYGKHRSSEGTIFGGCEYREVLRSVDCKPFTLPITVTSLNPISLTQLSSFCTSCFRLLKSERGETRKMIPIFGRRPMSLLALAVARVG
jgi:hypothetical protein